MLGVTDTSLRHRSLKGWGSGGRSEFRSKSATYNLFYCGVFSSWFNWCTGRL